MNQVLKVCGLIWVRRISNTRSQRWDDLSGSALDIGSSPGLGRRAEDFQVEFFIQLRTLTAKSFGQQFRRHIAQDAVVSRRVFAQCRDEARSHQAWVSSLLE